MALTFMNRLLKSFGMIADIIVVHDPLEFDGHLNQQAIALHGTPIVTGASTRPNN
ncbi:MAG: hypothetical protein CM15mP68_3550 [Pseudomonadota bacterium]|nr:MAG: hypothetical protein CM15mP68_3550 [Pseudomonadota bacterium]